MIGLLKNWWFLAAVKAELLAQHRDQAFVDRICHLPANRALLESIRRTSYFRGTKIAPFLSVCELLGASFDTADLNEDDQKLCAALLAQRLLKVSGDPAFRLRHVLIIGSLEEKLASSRHFAEATQTSTSGA